MRISWGYYETPFSGSVQGPPRRSSRDVWADTGLATRAQCICFEELKLSQKGLEAIADDSQVLPDDKNYPRIASRDEIYAMLAASYRR